MQEAGKMVSAGRYMGVEQPFIAYLS